MSEWTGVITEVVDEVTLLKLEVARQKDIKRIVNDTLVSVAIYADKLKTENTRLKELNREMVTTLKEIAEDLDVLWAGTISDELLQKANWLIVKTGEGKQ